MSVIDKLASSRGHRDEAPNLELARDLASRRDEQGIRELVENLLNRDKNIQADCIKVLYEIGTIEPKLIADYADDFVKLLASRNNRLVWGGMTALAEVAKANPNAVFDHLDEIKKAKEVGSVITVDNAISTLAWTAAGGPEYNLTISPYLIDHLLTCRSREVPQHAERTLPAVNGGNQAAFITSLEKRMPDLTSSGQARVRKVVSQARHL